MSTDIVTELRERFEFEAADEIERLRMAVIAEVGAQQEQAEENERLRRLITEWADAHDEYSRHARVDGARFEDAICGLRKAVWR